MPLSESTLENYFKKQCDKYNIWQNKFTSGVTGVPDRVVITNGTTAFVELKTKKGVLSERQKRIISQIQSHGGIVFIPRSKKDIDDIIKNLTNTNTKVIKNEHS